MIQLKREAINATNQLDDYQNKLVTTLFSFFIDLIDVLKTGNSFKRITF